MWWLSLVPWKTILGGIVALAIAGMFGWNMLKDKKIDRLQAEINAAQRAKEIAPVLQEQGRQDERIQRLARELAVIVDNEDGGSSLLNDPRIVEFFDRVYDNTTNTKHK